MEKGTSENNKAREVVVDILIGSSEQNLIRYRGQNSTSETTSDPKTEEVKPNCSCPNDDWKKQTGNDDEKNHQIGKNGRLWRIMEWLVFFCCVGGLIASFTFKKFTIEGLDSWKFFVLVLIVFCGRLYTDWMMIVVLSLMKIKLLLNEKILYFVYGVRLSVRFFVWLGLVLLSWVILVEFDSSGVKMSKEVLLNLKVLLLKYIGRALASSLVGAALWLLKSLFVKTIASHFQGKRFFEKIKEAVFTQHVLEVLSNARSGETSRDDANIRSTLKWAIARLQGNHSAPSWTMKKIIDALQTSKLSYVAEEIFQKVTSSNKLPSEGIREGEALNQDQLESSSKFITRENFLRYFSEGEELDEVIRLIKGEKLGVKSYKLESSQQINEDDFKEWLSKAYDQRVSLTSCLEDSKTAIEELNRLASGLVLIVIVIVWLLIMGFLTTKILLLISSQLVLLAFIFGNTVRAVFEAIIFVFVVHPFNVGDRCLIDGVQMVVEEVNLLTTIFLKYDNEKIYYPNSVLATKPIGNFYRSPKMGDAVEFAIDVSTSGDKIKALKDKINEHLKNSEEWCPEHCVIVKDFDDVNKIKMALYVTHTINFQEYGKKIIRRSDLILKLKEILEGLCIKYHMLPLQAQFNFKGSPF